MKIIRWTTGQDNIPEFTYKALIKLDEVDMAMLSEGILSKIDIANNGNVEITNIGIKLTANSKVELNKKIIDTVSKLLE